LETRCIPGENNLGEKGTEPCIVFVRLVGESCRGGGGEGASLVLVWPPGPPGGSGRELNSPTRKQGLIGQDGKKKGNTL